jgi:hypothetical protein
MQMHGHSHSSDGRFMGKRRQWQAGIGLSVRGMALAGYVQIASGFSSSCLELNRIAKAMGRQN